MSYAFFYFFGIFLVVLISNKTNAMEQKRRFPKKLLQNVLNERDGHFQ